MVSMGKKYLLLQVSYFVAPILYHSSAEGSIGYFCFLLIEVVDSYALLILAILFIIALALTKNLLLKISTFFKTQKSILGVKNLTPRSLKLPSKLFQEVKHFFYKN